MEDKKYLRAHLRMDVMIILQHREITPEELSALEKIPFHNSEDEELPFQSFSLTSLAKDKEKDGETGTLDPFLVNALLDINLKLNIILGMLSGEGETSLFNQKPVEVSLSEGGIGFNSPTKIKEGTLLELKMMLPVFPIAMVKVCGKVVRAHPLPEGGYRIGVQYTHVKEEDQNKIFRYVFKRHREDLKNQKLQNEQTSDELS